MKRQDKITRKRKEEISISRAARDTAGSVEYDRKAAILDAALRNLGKAMEEAEKEKPKEKIKLDIPSGVLYDDEEIVPLTDEEVIKQAFTTSIREDEKEAFTTVDTFESDVLEIDGVVVIIRAAKRSKAHRYTYKLKCSDKNTVAYFAAQRIKRVLDSVYEFEIPCWDGDRDMTLGELREKQKLIYTEATVY